MRNSLIKEGESIYGKLPVVILFTHFVKGMKENHLLRSSRVG